MSGTDMGYQVCASKRSGFPKSGPVDDSNEGCTSPWLEAIAVEMCGTDFAFAMKDKEVLPDWLQRGKDKVRAQLMLLAWHMLCAFALCLFAICTRCAMASTDKYRQSVVCATGTHLRSGIRCAHKEYGDFYAMAGGDMADGGGVKDNKWGHDFHGYMARKEKKNQPSHVDGTRVQYAMQN
eukprot:378688-Rhodomonas_salina.3